MHAICQIDSEANCFKNLGVKIAPLTDNLSTLLDAHSQFVCAEEKPIEKEEGEEAENDASQIKAQTILRFAHT